MITHRSLSLLAAFAAVALSIVPAAPRACDCAHGGKDAKTSGHEGHGGDAGAAHAGDAADPHAAHRAAAAAAAASAPAAAAASALRFPDEALLDQDGRERKLLSDVLADRIVVLDFIFTSCTTVCPVLSGIMTGVQQELGGAKDVALVSLSVDPTRDTPPRLQAYAKRWKAGPGWTFLTGDREAVRRVLEAAGAYTADFTNHAPMVLVGDARTGKWARLNGFPKRAQVLATIDALRAERAPLTASAEVSP